MHKVPKYFSFEYKYMSYRELAGTPDTVVIVRPGSETRMEDRCVTHLSFMPNIPMLQLIVHICF